MPDIRLVVPSATENLVTNPSIENDTDGWTAVGSTISREFDEARFGSYSLKIITDGVAVREGVFFRVDPDSKNTAYVASAYVRGAGSVIVRIRDGFNGNQVSSKKIDLKDNRWQRIDILGGSGSVVTDDLRIFIETDAVQAITFRIDGAQIEPQTKVTTYCDGDQEGCVWNIVAHETKSTRDGEFRGGGTLIDLAGDCTANDDLYVTIISGFGMPPLRSDFQEFALTPGAFYQRSKVESRVLQMVFYSKNEEASDSSAIELTRLHELRQTLIDQIKPDRVKDDQAFVLQYSEGGRELFIDVRYEAGLEFAGDIRNDLFNQFTLRLLAVEPLWREDDQEVNELEFSDSQFSPDLFILAKVKGVWDNLNFGLDDRVQTVAQGPDGKLYAGGEFLVANNNASAVDPQITANRIAYWDGTQWRAMGDGFNNDVSNIEVHPDGTVWAVGTFTDLQGGAGGNFNRVAFWDWDTETWNNLPLSGGGNGLSGNPSQIAIHENGNVYLGGTFTSDDDGNTLNRICFWDGGTFQQAGEENGLNAEVNSMVFSPIDKKIYVGGDATQEAGGTNLTSQVIMLDVDDNSFSSLGSSNELSPTATANIPGLAVDAVGGIYATGTFGDATHPSDFRGIAYWNGSEWQTVGGGLRQGATPFTWSSFLVTVSQFDELVYAGTNNQDMGDIESISKVNIWNGSVWNSIDFDQTLSTSLTGRAVTIVTDSGDIYITPWLSDNTVVSENTVVTNIGSKAVAPTLIVEGPGVVRYLENQTVDARIWLNIELQENEILTIDFGQKTAFTTFRSNVLDGISPGSDFGRFVLLPGENIITTFITEDVNAKAQIRYTPIHWSVDAVGG